MIQKVVKINGIEIKSGDLHIIRDKNGRTNLESLFSSADSDKDAQPIYLDNISLKDIHVRYQDLISEDEYRLHVNRSQLKACIKEEYIKIEATGKGEIDFISISDLNYAEQQPFEVHGNIDILRANNLYNFSNVQLKIGKNTGLLTGSMQSIQDGNKYDIEISDVRSNIESLIHAIPKEYAQYIKEYKLDGQAEGHIRVNGIKNKVSNPFVSIISTVTAGEIQKKNSSDALKGISGKVTYNNGDGASLKTSVLHASDMHTGWSGQKINSNFVIRDFIKPQADGSINGEIKLELTKEYFENIGIEKIKGSVFINNLEFKGLYLTDRISKTDGIQDLIAKCSLRDINCIYKEEKIYISDGELSLSDDRLELSDAHALVGDSDFELDASVDGFITGILRHEKIANLAAVAKSKKVNAEQLWDFYKRIKKKEEQVLPVMHTSSKGQQWFERLRSSVKLSTTSLDFGKVHADDVVGSIEQMDRTYKLKMEALSFSGNVSTESEGRFYPDIVANSKIVMDGADIAVLFSQFDNFEQKFIRSEHLSGDVNIKSHVKSYWDEDGNLDKKNMEVDAYFDLRNGEIKDLEVLTQFSKYVDISELSRIKFSKLSNLIEFRKGEVIIPAMYIQNSACNLMICGFHDLDNQIHYNIKVNAGQTIGNKLKKRKNKSNIIPSKKDGWFNLYFNIDGHVDNYSYELNKSLVKRGFEFGEQKKKLILSRLTSVFGPIEQFNEPLEWLDIPEYDEKIESVDDGPEYLNNFE